MESWAEFRGQLARASASVVLPVSLFVACVGDDPSANAPAPTTDGGADAGATSSSGSSGTSSSGGNASDAGDSGVAKCDPRGKFATILPVPGFENVDAKAGHLTPDERTLYFHVISPTARLKVATRTSTGEAFGAAQDVLGIAPAMDAGSYIDAYPAISADDRVLFWESSRDPGTTSSGIYSASRTAVGAGSAFSNVALIGNFPSPAHGPSVVGNGEIVYGHHPVIGINAVFRAQRTGVVYAVEDIALGGEAAFPAVSPDDRVMYFSSPRSDAGHGDIWVTVRTGSHATDPWDPPTKVDDLSAAGKYDIPSWVSADYCRVYFFRNQDLRILVATRSP